MCSYSRCSCKQICSYDPWLGANPTQSSSALVTVSYWWLWKVSMGRGESFCCWLLGTNSLKAACVFMLFHPQDPTTSWARPKDFLFTFEMTAATPPAKDWLLEERASGLQGRQEHLGKGPGARHCEGHWPIHHDSLWVTQYHSGKIGKIHLTWLWNWQKTASSEALGRAARGTFPDL